MGEKEPTPKIIVQIFYYSIHLYNSVCSRWSPYVLCTVQYSRDIKYPVKITKNELYISLIGAKFMLVQCHGEN